MTTADITSGPTATETAQDDVRAVTDNEVAFFGQNGWVLLPGLVSPELCRAILERGKPRLIQLMAGTDTDFASPEARREHMTILQSVDGIVTDNKKWVEWRGAIRSARDQVFGRAALAKTMGRNVQRLLGRDQAMRVYHDIFMCKLPDNVSLRTEWHQDSVAFPVDRNALTVWIALDEIQPDQGPVQFYFGSHRCGLLGRGAPDRKTDLLDEYPNSPALRSHRPTTSEAGDATVHHGLVVHGAGANRTTQQRWSFAVCYIPSDARYSGAPNHDCDGFGLRVGQPIDHPSFTLVPN